MKLIQTVASAAVAFVALATFSNSAQAFIVSNIDDAPESWATAMAATPNTLATPGNWTVTPTTENTNSSGVYRSPFDDEGVVGDNSAYINNSYWAVGPSNLPNPAIMTFTGNQNSLSFLWGSVDSYNKLEFWNNNLLVETIWNTDITPAAGNGPGLGASYVKISGLVFDEIRFSATRNAFEFSNMSTTPVPLPAAAWLLLSGLAGLGVVGRRKKA